MRMRSAHKLWFPSPGNRSNVRPVECFKALGRISVVKSKNFFSSNRRARYGQAPVWVRTRAFRRGGIFFGRKFCVLFESLESARAGLAETGAQPSENGQEWQCFEKSHVCEWDRILVPLASRQYRRSRHGKLSEKTRRIGLATTYRHVSSPAVSF